MSNYLIVLAVLVSLAGCAAAVAKTSTPSSKEVTFVGAGGLELSGTLTMPAADGPVPGFLLLPGSGPTDRDGNSGLGIRTDLLKQIAEALAKEGVATLRFDKRAIVRYSVAWPKEPAALNSYFSYRNFVEDAKSAYRTLGAQPGIAKGRTGILGHSEGGLFALQIASDLKGAPDVPFKLILLGTAGRSLGPVIHEQLQRQIRAPSVPKELGEKLLAYSDQACAALIAGKPLPPDEPALLKPLYNPTVLDIVTAYLRIDPAELARQYSGPVLIVNGQDDTQVSATKDAPRLEQALRNRSEGTVKLDIVPKASHNLKPTEQAGADAFEGPVAAKAMQAILNFAIGVDHAQRGR